MQRERPPVQVHLEHNFMRGEWDVFIRDHSYMVGPGGELQKLDDELGVLSEEPPKPFCSLKREHAQALVEALADEGVWPRDSARVPMKEHLRDLRREAERADKRQNKMLELMYHFNK